MVAQLDRSKLTAVTNPDKIVYYVNVDACAKFADRYPRALELARSAFKGKTLLKRYCKFIEAQNRLIAGSLGASTRLVESPSFGSQVFEDYEWMGVSGHWAEFFTYAQKAIQ